MQTMKLAPAPISVENQLGRAQTLHKLPRNKHSPTKVKTAVACNPCRQRKTKCDGNLPCKRCISRQDPDCRYSSIDRRRLNRSAFVNDYQQLLGRFRHYEDIVSSIRENHQQLTSQEIVNLLSKPNYDHSPIGDFETYLNKDARASNSVCSDSSSGEVDNLDESQIDIFPCNDETEDMRRYSMDVDRCLDQCDITSILNNDNSLSPSIFSPISFETDATPVNNYPPNGSIGVIGARDSPELYAEGNGSDHPRHPSVRPSANNNLTKFLTNINDGGVKTGQKTNNNLQAFSFPLIFDESLLATASDISNETQFLSFLLSQYLTWSSMLYDFVPPILFIRDLIDLNNGEKGCKFCSPALLSAILGLSCIFSSEMHGKISEPLFSTYDGHALARDFFSESKNRLQNEDLTMSPLSEINLSLVNALTIACLSLGEAEVGLSKTAWELSSVFFDMATKLADIQPVSLQQQTQQPSLSNPSSPIPENPDISWQTGQSLAAFTIYFLENNWTYNFSTLASAVSLTSPIDSEQDLIKIEDFKSTFPISLSICSLCGTDTCLCTCPNPPSMDNTQSQSPERFNTHSSAMSGLKSSSSKATKRRRLSLDTFKSPSQEQIRTHHGGSRNVSISRETIPITELACQMYEVKKSFYPPQSWKRQVIVDLITLHSRVERRWLSGANMSVE